MSFAGRSLLWLRQRFGHGLRVAYYRDVVRPQILRSAPVESLCNDACEIHVLTSQHDWINLVWVLKSFYFSTGRRYALCIHEDGSLSADQIRILREHFPDARVVSRPEADDRVKVLLQQFPTCQQFRDTNPLALKVFDFQVFLENERMLLLDSDILFFDTPEVLIQRIESGDYRLNTLNRDWAHGYTVEVEDVGPYLGFQLHPRINSGLGLIHKGSLCFEEIERWISLPGVYGHPHRIEQTLIALSCSQFGFEFLPAEYDVRIDNDGASAPCKHFTGPIRHLMYSRGIPRLLKGQILSCHA